MLTVALFRLLGVDIIRLLGVEWRQVSERLPREEKRPPTNRPRPRKDSAMISLAKPPRFNTTEARLRTRVHSLKRQLDYDEPTYRNILAALTGERYARSLNETQLEYVVDVLEQFRTNKARAARPVEYVSDADALAVLG